MYELDYDEEPVIEQTTRNSAAQSAGAGDGRITEKIFGIARRPVPQLSQEDIDCLYRELRVTKESHNVRVVFVKGTDDMTRFAVEKIFAEYHPCRVEIVDKSSCLVSFASRADCVRMMIGMTKPLRRFRATRAAEDGELTDSDGEEEEGQIKQEKGDDVALVAHSGFTGPRDLKSSRNISIVAVLSQEDIDCLYRELRVTKESHNVRVVFVKGTDDMTRFAVEKIFAEYHPCRVEIVDKSSCLVSFASRADCVRMMIGMTKPLRRFRATRTAEDGELTDSDGEEEEGQIKQEKGDDVALVAHSGDAPKRIREDVVEVDVDAIDIPHGRWRVVTSHVPERRFMIAKFATNAEITEARKIIAITEDDLSRKRKKEVDDQGFTYTWSTEQKVRPGLNVFDEKGNELEWDYEHDTRFYEDPNVASEKDESKPAEADAGAPQARVVKGRGAKKGSLLFNGIGNTLASDDLDNSALKRRRIAARLTAAEDMEEDESDEDEWRREPSSPTPQPWDRPKGRLANRVTRQ
ncbi:hypothetical protein RB195_016160 [Necator americanus]